MAETPDLLPIGTFSALSRLSVRMLRHYDAHGVLVPAAVDPLTNYRRYAPRQLRDAADVRTLRDVGFGVSAICALLASRGTPAWTAALELQRDVLADELRAAQGRLALITRLLDQGEPMSVTVDRRTLPAMTVVALRGTVPTYSDEPLLWQRIGPGLVRQGVRPIGPCGCIEHDEEYTERDVDLSVFVPVPAGTRVEAPLEVVYLPERDCLVARVHGPYTQIVEAHDVINARMAAEGLAPLRDASLASKVVNVYLVTPEEADAADLVTEVCVPLARP